MKEILVPSITAGLTFLISYLTLRVKYKEQKVAQSTSLLKDYSDLIDTYRQENILKDQTIARQRKMIERLQNRHRAQLHALQEALELARIKNESNQRNRD